MNAQKKVTIFFFCLEFAPSDSKCKVHYKSTQKSVKVHKCTLLGFTLLTRFALTKWFQKNSSWTLWAQIVCLSSCRAQLLLGGLLGQPLVWSESASSFSFELISCFVPEALPLNHSLQSHCASPESERGHRGGPKKREWTWKRSGRERIREDYRTGVFLFVFFLMSVLRSL